MKIQDYIDSINKRCKLGNATEHTFRGDLQQLIESVVPDVRATNEPKRQTCGAPDYILTRKDIPIGFIEAKNIGDKDLDGEKKTGNKEQFDRYKTSLNNIFFTDYIDFHLYRDGQFVTKIAIAELTENGIKPFIENFANFERLLKDFCTHIGQTITSSKKLAEMMAGKARLLSEVIEKALTSDELKQENSTLKEQMNAFRQILIHDISPKGFADVYAQTIAYGMFAARYHDPTLPTFSRQEAAELIPKSNPFLRKLFGYIAGPDLDDRIKWIVDDLINIFLACDLAEILKDYGKTTQMEDPIIHFYETFLSEYDPKLRKARGVWYTPQPVVNFIVRAVDDILKTEFDLPLGLAEKVQILDPATGTGTFLAEVVKHIYQHFEGQTGLWSNYVETNLLPRLNGFELLMASYAMAHLKLDMLLTETGFKPATNQRFRVFLTNSLEEQHPDTQTLFASWLSDEANGANHIKRETPLMVVLGNPPYAVSSSNKGEWIQSLIGDYKKGLNERKINLDDDYIKFIRLGQHFIDKKGSGILAYISNNSFIDGITHRQMRKHLLESFDKIYILDLHGNAKKKEVCPDGSPDQNVFDIMQGVSVNIFVKTGKKKKNELGEVFHFDLQGKREYKSEFLLNSSITSINWNNLNYKTPEYYFVPLNYDLKSTYYEYFSIHDIFPFNSTGIETQRDAVSIFYSVNELNKCVSIFLSETIDTIRIKYNLGIDGRDWTIRNAKLDLEHGFVTIPILFRPFDNRFCPYTGNSKGIIAYPRYELNKHFINELNLGIISPRFFKEDPSYFITDKISGHKALSAYDKNFVFPLYLYPETNKQQEQSEHRENLELRLEEARTTLENLKKSFVTIKKMYDAFPNPDAETKKFYKAEEKNYKKYADKVELMQKELSAASTQTLFDEPTRTPNLHAEIVKQIADKLDLTFTNEKEITANTFAPIDILDYIYAVLHSPSYREKYKEFLKIDFPRVPYPRDKESFWQLVKLGGEIRQIHLLESPVVEKFITEYPVDGNHIVTKPIFIKGKVYINDTQYFDNVPEVAWNFYIGGYQPAQKWLKDRKDRKLEFDDILHYQKIIVALSETDRLMKQIDKTEYE